VAAAGGCEVCLQLLTAGTWPPQLLQLRAGQRSQVDAAVGLSCARCHLPAWVVAQPAAAAAGTGSPVTCDALPGPQVALSLGKQVGCLQG
jgi:hypothetical protein